MSVCPSCGHDNQPGAKFCSGCGVALGQAAPVAEAERKTVTVLFADLVGFTSRAEQLDPEDVRAVLSPYYARLRAELERFGGTVEKFIGDAVMALFGAPTAHEDDPERAVRAAVAIRDWAREEGQVEVRLGVATGEALITLGARPGQGEGMAAGDVVNTAARLQAAAPVNGVLAGERTFRATRGAIDYRPAGRVAAKGKREPVPVWEAVAARARVGVDVAHQAAAVLVGRDRELGILRDALSRVRAERSPLLVTLVGVPGIGKSRLLYELRKIADAEAELIAWRQGRSLPYGEGGSFWALAEIVKAQAGILVTDPVGEAKAKLAQMTAGVMGGAAEADWVARHLFPLAGLGSGGDGSTGGDRRSEVFTAWRQFVEALAEARPLVLVFEDLHWADDGLLDFVDYLAGWAGGVPLLVVCTARPELLARRPGWGGGKPNALTLSLTPLSDDETAWLIGLLTGRAVIEADQQAVLLARAGGNPLFAEQYVQMLADQQAGRQPPVSGLPVPESVQGIIGARLDLLAPPEKRLLYDAAVIGKVFWPGAVAVLGGGNGHGELEGWLHGLEAKQFVRRARASSLAGETQYAFTHVLVRDVAYGQIPRAARAEKHIRAAGWIESLGRAGDHAEMLAHHYLSALELARAASQDVSDLVPRVRVALSRAARRASEMFNMDLSAQFAQASLDLGGGVDAGLVLGEAKFRSGHHAEAESVLASMVPRCRTDSELARIASARAHNFHNLLGDPAAATAVLDEALAVVSDVAPRLALLGRLATLKVFEPDLAGALAAAKPLLASDDDVLISRGSYVTSIALAFLGRSEEAVAVAYAGLQSHRRASGIPQLPEAQLIGAVFGHAAAGRFAQAEADAITGCQASLAAGDKEGYATHLFLQGCVLIERGQLTRASKTFLDGVSVNREIHDPPALRWCLAGLALSEAMSGHTDRAMAAAAERDELPSGPMMVYEPDLVDRGRAWVSAAAGELSRACEILAAAADRAAACRLRIAEARVLHDIARLGRPDSVAPRLAALAEVVDGQFVAALAAHAAALAGGKGADLEAAGLGLESLGASLLAAEAYLAAAASYRSQGLARPASAMARRAGELAATCGDVRTPGLSFGAAASS